MNRRNNQNLIQGNNAANNNAGGDQQAQQQPAQQQQEEEQQRQQRVLQEENDRLRVQIDQLRQAQEQADVLRRLQVNNVKLPVPILDSQNISVQKWIEKYEKEADRVGFSDEDKLSHLSLYVDAEEGRGQE